MGPFRTLGYGREKCREEFGLGFVNKSFQQGIQLMLHDSRGRPRTGKGRACDLGRGGILPAFHEQLGCGPYQARQSEGGRS